MLVDDVVVVLTPLDRTWPPQALRLGLFAADTLALCAVPLVG
jgi:hypothetical protein